jgi:hypothetical protein
MVVELRPQVVFGLEQRGRGRDWMALAGQSGHVSAEAFVRVQAGFNLITAQGSSCMADGFASVGVAIILPVVERGRA